METISDEAPAMRENITGRGPPKLVVEGASVTFKQRGKDFVAVNGIDLEVRDGEFVVIVGPSGSGKSTFLMALAGLVPLSSGSISIEGRRVTKPGPELAVVFQDAVAHDPRQCRLRARTEGHGEVRAP